MESRQAYRESLRALHGELAATEVPAGSPTAAVLTDLLEDVREVLEHPGELPFSHHRTLMGRLEQAAESFELAHPKLAGAVGSVISSLNAIGI